MSPQANADVIWVVGDDTGVGKTTTTAALIRRLNSMKIKTLGFKPYAGSRLISVIGLLENIAVGDGFLVGPDARELAKASPLTPVPLLEVVNPSWRIAHPSRDVSVFVRKGSAEIRRRDFFQTRNAVEFCRRSDFARLNEHIKLPMNNISIRENSGADAVDALEQDIQTSSFAQLQALGPEVIICEGAGRLLPYWVGAPPVKHIFLVTGGDLYLFPDINIDINPREGPSMKSVPTIAAIRDDLRRGMQLRDGIPVVSSADRDRMDQFVSKFLVACT